MANFARKQKINFSKGKKTTLTEMGGATIICTYNSGYLDIRILNIFLNWQIPLILKLAEKYFFTTERYLEKIQDKYQPSAHVRETT
jgi:hypothetical protein